MSSVDVANLTATEIRSENGTVCMTPFEAFWNDLTRGDNRPDISHLRVIGSKCFVHIEPEKRVKSDKLGARAWQGILIGFVGKYIYKVYNPNDKKIHITPRVVFHEQAGEESDQAIKRWRPGGTFRRKKEDYTLSMATQSHHFPDPPTLDAALAQPDGDLWWEAAVAKIVNLVDKDAIVLSNQPISRKDRSLSRQTLQASKKLGQADVVAAYLNSELD
ncbi:hypothetical protein F66182_7921 [Fusarium sp. NRRL 66182]|nr:hypothetical protein F66182_7921 [Fusarium sp. NRRL 66182]